MKVKKKKMNNLPVETIWQIFEKLNYKDQVVLYQTNKKMYEYYKELNLRSNIEILWNIKVETEKYFPHKNSYTTEIRKKKKGDNKSNEELGIILGKKGKKMAKRIMGNLRRNNLHKENVEETEKEFEYKEVEVLEIHQEKYSTQIKFITNI